MSERGSFVTEYVYCNSCFKALCHVLLSKEKYLCSTTIPHWMPEQDELPIIAGKIGGLYAGEEAVEFDGKLREKIEKLICHPVRIAVLPENGEPEILTMRPAED